MSALKKLASETALYGISTILGRSINFLLVFVHTAAFLPDELGINVKMYSYAAVANILYTYGMETAFFRFAAEDKQKYYNIIQSALLVSSTFFSGMLILLASPVMKGLGYPHQEIYLIWLAVIIWIDSVTAIPFARLRVEKRGKKFVIAKICNILINVGLNIFFLLGLKKIAEGDYWQVMQPLAQSLYRSSIGVGYIFLANLMANATFFFFLRKEFFDFQWQFDWAIFKEVFIYSFPILLMGLAGMVNQVFDRMLLEAYLPTNFYRNLNAQEALGVYGNAYKLSIFMALSTQAFRYAAEPFFLSKTTDKNSPATMAQATKWFTIVCVFIWLGVCLNLDWLKMLFLRRAIYWQGVVVVPILLLANLFLGIYYNISVWFKLNKQTQYGTYITLVGLFITVALNILLIPRLGYMGCAYAFLASCFSMTALCYYWGQKFYPIPYPTKQISLYIISAGLLIYGSMQFAITNLWLSIPYHNLLLLLYTLGVVVAERETLLPARLRKKLF